MSETPRTQSFADQYAPYDLENSKVDWIALFGEWAAFACELERETQSLKAEVTRLNQLLSRQ